MVMQMTVNNPKTSADAAAIIAHGPEFAKQLGRLADHDERVRKAIDFISSGTDNPYAAVMVAAMPLLAQVLRNHERETESPIEVKVPFIKRVFRLKWRLKLKNPVLLGLSKPPELMQAEIFGNSSIMASLAEAGINPAWEGVPSRNGRVAAKR